MLKPYVCVACEKVIITKEGVPTLVSLFSKITVQAIQNVPEIPANAVVPTQWTVFSMWDTEPGDELKEYMICTQMLFPDKSAYGSVARIKLNVEAEKRSQSVMTFNGFPVGQIGSYTIHTWIEENQQKVFGPIEFKIDLEMVQPKS
jgi:hypothetical protein